MPTSARVGCLSSQFTHSLPPTICRELDVPEREQLHRGADPATTDLSACAAWVWDHLLGERRSSSLAQNLLQARRRRLGALVGCWWGCCRRAASEQARPACPCCVTERPPRAA